MDLKRTLWRFLNPRSNLGNVPHSTERPQGRVHGRLRARDVVTNLPLMMGALVVLGLFLLVLFGPLWAPENPYVSGQHIVPHYDVQQRETVSPPLAPSPDYPLGTDRWGNDLLSLLMHGARNTLVACSFITMVRVLLGLFLGGIAGWNEGRPSDQIVMGLIGVTTSVPTLISSMILIYALDIRRGLPVFIVALSAIGWTEIAQYIRSEFLVLRKAPYIEGARATGLDGLAIAVRHVLPNVLPQLLVISFLEMAAVMMILGELGFVGVYIGGGSRISVETDPFVFEFRTLIEVPEWGAMLADGYRWLRARPFVIMPPAVAFFVSVVGFNALGEGLRRLVEHSALSTAFLLRKRMLTVVAALVLATVFIMNNTGPAPWFAKVASAFNGELAYEHVQALAAMEGRGAGQEGGMQAAAYIEEKFRAYGLEPSWKGASYVYPLAVRLARPVSQPGLSLVGADGTTLRSFRHQLDFGYVTDGHGGSGDVRAPLAFVGFRRGEGDLSWESYKGLDLRDRIVLLQQGNAPPEFVAEALIRGARGVLWVVGDERYAVRSRVRVDGRETLRRPQFPVFRIRPAVAEAMLSPDGIALSELLAQETGVDQAGPGWYVKDLGIVVHMSLALGEPQDVEVPCVLGYKPGSDFDLAEELIVLFASYDGLGVDPDGTVYPAANYNASGVGLLLEMARLWHEQRLDARRSVLFVAWGAGQLDESGAEAFLNKAANFRHLPALTPNRPQMVLQLEGVGAGEDVLYLHPRSSTRLLELFSGTAAQVGVPAVSEAGASVRLDDFVTRRIASIYVTWLDSYVTPDEDHLERIDADKLQSVGEVLALTLTQVVRQTRY
jgi:ABC-type dipeptide/oligopeptide/nickel transport system permease subunit